MTTHSLPDRGTRGTASMPLIAAMLALATATLFSGIEPMIGPIMLRPFDIIFATLLGLGALRAAADQSIMISRRIVTHPALLAFVAFGVYVSLNALMLNSVTVAVREALQRLEFLLLLLVLAHVLRQDRARATFTNVFRLSLGLMAVATALLHVSQGKMTRYKDYGDPKMTFALWAFMLFVPLYVGQERGNWRKVVVFLPALALMALSGERKGWAGFLAAVAVVVLIGALRTFKGVVRTVLAVTLVAVALGVATRKSDYVAHQVTSIADFASRLRLSGEIEYADAITLSNRARLFLLDFSLRTLSRNPVFGVGAERFKPELEKFTGEKAHGAHNDYLKTAVETGYVGLTLYMLVWVFLIGQSLLFFRRRSNVSEVDAFLAVGLCVYAIVLNAFLAGGGANMFFIVLPASYVLALSSAARQPAAVGAPAVSAVAAPTWGPLPGPLPGGAR